MVHFQIENLSFSYPTAKGMETLENVNLTIEKGEYIVLCGASGSGKTTLLRQLKTVLAPYGTKSKPEVLEITRKSPDRFSLTASLWTR